jgi:MFS family permease
VLNGRLLDWNFRRLATQLGITIDRKHMDKMRHFPIERARIQSVFFANAVQTSTMLCYGWTLERHAPLAVPLILQFILGFGMVASSNSMSTLLVDLFPDQPATASAASNLLRCLFGAIGAAVIDEMLTGLGLGWTFVVLGVLIGLSSVLLVIEVKYGMKWRGTRWDRLAEKKKVKEEKERQRLQVTEQQEQQDRSVGGTAEASEKGEKELQSEPEADPEGKVEPEQNGAKLQETKNS